MRAAVVRRTGGPDALVLETLPDPTPAAREVLVQVAHCGVCFHDVVTRNGTLRAGVETPFIPGHEVAGTVVALGRDVRGIRLGERVASTQRHHVCGHCRYCRTAREPLCAEAAFLGDKGLNGGYADFVAVEADNLVPVPEGVPLDAASIAACAIGTAYHAVVGVGQVRAGETVLVTGAGGGVGIHAVQLAHAAGATVLAATGSAAKAEALRRAGAHVVVQHDKGAGLSDAVRDATKGEGAEVVIDTVGTPLFAETRRSVARGGRWVMVGQLTGEFVPFNPAQLFLKGISLLSSTSVTREELRRCLALLAQGTLRAVLGEALPLSAAAEAHRRLEAGAATGRMTLVPGG